MLGIWVSQLQAGTMLFFLDGDDYLSPDFYKNLLLASNNNKIDIIKESDIIHICEDRE